MLKEASSEGIPTLTVFKDGTMEFHANGDLSDKIIDLIGDMNG